MQRASRFDACAGDPSNPCQPDMPLWAKQLALVAEFRHDLNSEGCQLVIAHLDIASRLQLLLRRSYVRHHLTDLQFRLSLVLQARETEAVSAAALADHAKVSRSAVTEAVDRLVRKGLATRIRSGTDRRFVCVQLTDVGREVLRTACQDYLEMATQVTRHVGAARIRDSLDAYAQVKDGIQCVEL
ncbi:hypothetical protein DB347_15035 [Opitutaceae bacterium EW11]|nr:hypothetical protein DB347_15035 [Opitutaceae bacterium EW11]